MYLFQTPMHFKQILLWVGQEDRMHLFKVRILGVYIKRNTLVFIYHIRFTGLQGIPYQEPYSYPQDCL